MSTTAIRKSSLFLPLALAGGLVLGSGVRCGASLFDSLKALSNRKPVGSGAVDPAYDKRRDGPKWIATADFDGDGHDDFVTTHVNGEISVVYGEGGQDFEDPQVTSTGSETLRGLICTDINNDAQPDIVAAAPYEGVLSCLQLVCADILIW